VFYKELMGSKLVKPAVAAVKNSSRVEVSEDHRRCAVALLSLKTSGLFLLEICREICLLLKYLVVGKHCWAESHENRVYGGPNKLYFYCDGWFASRDLSWVVQHFIQQQVPRRIGSHWLVSHTSFVDFPHGSSTQMCEINFWTIDAQRIEEGRPHRMENQLVNCCLLTRGHLLISNPFSVRQ
jgi:hypothetical protein